ncbi:MAG TPA: hypothetical protein VMB21_17335 [Candidatus Limnocylindria bacterium]|jgi:hypothetical protein|nr:hypothetical protein [Candidatus Limnocylindria bacterium]
MNLATRFLLPAVLLATVVNAFADTTGFVTPSFRGEPGTEYGIWKTPFNFTVPFSTPTGPGNVANPGDTTGAVIRQVAPVPDEGSLFIDPAGNINCFQFIAKFTLSDVNASAVDSVVFQVRTGLGELDYPNVKLSYDLGTGVGIQHVTGTRTELARGSGGPGFGSYVSSKFEFNLAGLGVHDYSIGFDGGNVAAELPDEISLFSASLDTHSASAVPEPESYAFGFACGLAAFAVWRRRSTA